ncbi:MAG: imidazolonepropionase [Melioribacteraceae bacterium]|nr:imidazolonepropionase [Melioribacteraceae bacterium]
MNTLLLNPSQIVTIDTNGKHEKRGEEMNSVSPLSDHSVSIDNGTINGFIPNKNVDKKKYDNVIDLSNKILLPGLIECHTHSVFAGSRHEEFNMRLNGKSYEEIALSGGGINSTVKSVRESSFEELFLGTKPKINRFIEQGVTTLEIKSGYGLSFYDEIKLLEVIKELNDNYAIDIIATFLGAHTYPPEYQNDKSKYLEVITKEMIPYVKDNSLAEWCDGFCEATAFSVNAMEQIFEAALNSKMKLKLHTDQFNSMGGIELALRMNAKSVDHLEVLNVNDILELSKSDTVSVLLPGVSYSLKYNYAPARSLIDSNCAVALATDFNPGSSHINNIGFIWSLAAFEMGMKTNEIISAYTINSAKALDISDYTGSLEVGKSADFAVFDVDDLSELFYDFSNNRNVMTIKKGEIIYEA